MNDYALISIVAMVGWLVLMMSSFASFKLGWSKTIQMALVWAAIFVGGTLLVGLFAGN